MSELFCPSLAFQLINANSQAEQTLTNSHRLTRHSHLLITIFWEAFTIHKDQHATEIRGANPRFSRKNSWGWKPPGKRQPAERKLLQKKVITVLAKERGMQDLAFWARVLPNDKTSWLFKIPVHNGCLICWRLPIPIYRIIRTCVRMIYIYIDTYPKALNTQKQRKNRVLVVPLES